MSAKKEPGRIEVSEAEFEALVQRLERDELTPEDRQLLRQIVQAVLWMGEELDQKSLSIQRLRRLFGVKTESLSKIFPPGPGPGPGKEAESAGNNSQESQASTTEPAPSGTETTLSKPAPKGHGRLGAKDFPDARCVFHPHEQLKPGDPCPQCKRGHLYGLDPGTVLRIQGQAPFAPVIHQPERLRCSSCGHVFTARLPQEVRLSDHRCDPRAHALLALFRYGSGTPMYRMEGLQKAVGTPLPASTQWDMLESLGNTAYPIYRALIRAGARSEQFHNDDTTIKILALRKALAEEESERTGIFTSGVIAQLPHADGGHRIALFFSGNQHAGENVGKVLKDRPGGLPIPRLMCDALSRNEPDGITMEVAFCLDHARRNFVDVATRYPEECRYFLETLATVYQWDSKTRSMTADERLAYHREHSLAVMERLKAWGAELLSQRKIEPNSGLGEAIRYFNKHWERLTGFCRTPGVPLSNAIVERLLKRAILHRKNSLFYKTQAGAWIGDILMSLIETARMAGINVLDYLTAINTHAERVPREPERFLPWNYQQTLSAAGPTPAAA